MPFNIAIVGTGNVATKHYIPFLAKQADVSLGYYNRTIAKSHAVAKQFPGVVLASLQEVADWKPAVAMVLTNETARFEVGCELIKLGVPKLFFEKPLVAANGQAHVSEQDFQNARAMLALARERGCETAMIFNYRFFDQTLAAKRIAAERNFGPVIQVAAQVNYACWSHCIDLIHSFAGPVEEISAFSGSVTREGAGNKAADLAVALRMTSGAVGTLIGTAGMAWQHPLYELTLTFERGRIHLRDLDGPMEILDSQKQVTETVQIGRDASRWTQYSSSIAKSLEAYLATLRQNQQPPILGLAGLQELQTEAAIRRSIAERRGVRVQEEFAVP